MPITDALLRHVLTTTKRIAVVGASNKPDRPSYGVMKFLIAQGYDVTPVNPGLAGEKILDRPVVATLDEAGPLDMVDIFRNSAAAAAPVDDAIRLGAQTVWLQLGVINHEAEAAAHAAGLNVIMDHCPAIEIPRLGLTRTETP
jgi:predicted CoA-binding protein